MLTPEIMDQLAELSKLPPLDADEKKVLLSDLTKVLQMVAFIETVDIQSIEPLYHPNDITQPLREDKVTEYNEQDRFQQIAPQIKAGLYIVPLMLDKG